METTHPRNAGYYYSGGLNASTDMYLLNGIRGPFTPSQWLELEQQALIYKYITANEPIPLHLLFPIISAFNSAAGFNVFNGGWGPFHLGYSNTAAPDLGRCRRTDGKKWRCAKDAVANHKYCEKHIKRRSRKHVEGQGSDHTKYTTTTKVASSSLPPMGFPGNGSPSSSSFDINLSHTHHQVNNLQSSATNPTMDAYVNRMHVNREDNVEGTELSFLPQATNLNCSETSFSNHKHLLHTFADWPNSQNADQLSNLCPGLQPHSPYDSTQLSNVSMSTTSSPTSEHLSLRQATNWMNISPEASMGGPLGEALQISNSTGESRKTSAFSLMPNELD